MSDFCATATDIECAGNGIDDALIFIQFVITALIENDADAATMSCMLWECKKKAEEARPVLDRIVRGAFESACRMSWHPEPEDQVPPEVYADMIRAVSRTHRTAAAKEKLVKLGNRLAVYEARDKRLTEPLQAWIEWMTTQGIEAWITDTPDRPGWRLCWKFTKHGEAMPG